VRPRWQFEGEAFAGRVATVVHTCRMGFIRWLGLVGVFALTLWLTLEVWKLDAILAGVLTIVTTGGYLMWLSKRDERGLR